MSFNRWLHSRRLSARIGAPLLAGVLGAGIGFLTNGAADTRIDFLVSTLYFALFKEAMDHLFKTKGEKR
jgi:hypothetical protein